MKQQIDKKREEARFRIAYARTVHHFYVRSLVETFREIARETTCVIHARIVVEN